jgi:hypothetical protein
MNTTSFLHYNLSTFILVSKAYVAYLVMVMSSGEVCYLRRLTLIKKIGMELKLPKTARGDVRALMRIDDRWFRRVTEDFLVMRRTILAYRSLLKTHQQLLNKYKALSEVERNILRPAINSLEEQMDTLARQITVEAGRRYPAYNKVG